MFLTHFIQIEKNIFFQLKGTFSEVSNPQTLYLSKIGPAFWLPSPFKIYNFFSDLEIYITGKCCASVQNKNFFYRNNFFWMESVANIFFRNIFGTRWIDVTLVQLILHIKYHYYLYQAFLRITVDLYLHITKKHHIHLFLLKIKCIPHWVFHHLMLNRRLTLCGLKVTKVLCLSQNQVSELLFFQWNWLWYKICDLKGFTTIIR